MLSRWQILLRISMCTQLIYCTHIANAATFVMKTNTTALDLLHLKLYFNNKECAKNKKECKVQKGKQYFVILN